MPHSVLFPTGAMYVAAQGDACLVRGYAAQCDVCFV